MDTTDHHNNTKQRIIQYISKLLGYSVSIGSLLTKLPQIAAIYQSRTTTGLSLSMYGIESITQYINILYHYTNKYSINTYGENINFFASNVIILLLFVKYSTSNKQTLHAVRWLLAPVLFSGLIYQPQYLSKLQSCAAPLYIISRIPQIYQNYTTQSTGQLSSATYTANFVGSVIRILTTATQLNNNLVLQSMFVTSCICNGILLAQIYMYRNNTMKQP